MPFFRAILEHRLGRTGRQIRDVSMADNASPVCDAACLFTQTCATLSSFPPVPSSLAASTLHSSSFTRVVIAGASVLIGSVLRHKLFGFDRNQLRDGDDGRKKVPSSTPVSMSMAAIMTGKFDPYQSTTTSAHPSSKPRTARASSSPSLRIAASISPNSKAEGA